MSAWYDTVGWAIFCFSFNMTSAQILAAFDAAKESDARFTAKMDVAAKLFLLLTTPFPDNNVVAFGSTMTQFALADGADLDLVLVMDRDNARRAGVKFVRGKNFSRDEMMTVLEMCQQFLKKKNDVVAESSSLELINAAVPILRFKSASCGGGGGGGVAVELSCSSGFKDGTYNTHLLMAYSRLDPRVRTARHDYMASFIALSLIIIRFGR